MKMKTAATIIAVLFSVILADAVTCLSADKDLELFVQTGHRGSINSASYSPDGKWCISAGWDNTIKLWDIATGREIRTLSGHSDAVTSVKFLNNGSMAISGSQDKSLALWDLNNGRLIRRFCGHTLGVTALDVSSDSRFAVSGSYDRTIRLWDISTGSELKRFIGHTGTVADVAMSKDGRFILSGGNDRKLKQWDVSTGRETDIRLEDADAKGGFASVALSSDGHYALAGGYEEVVRLWNLESGKIEKVFKILYRSSGFAIRSVAFSPDGKHVIAGDEDNHVRVWSIETGKEIWSHDAKRQVSSVEYSPDGRNILVSTIDLPNHLFCQLFILDSATGRKIFEFKGHSITVTSAACTPDGKYLLAGSSTRTGGENNLRLWDIVEGKLLKWPYAKHFDPPISAVAVSPDGKYFITGGEERIIKLWDAATGDEICSSPPARYNITSVAFSGKRLAVLCGSGDDPELWNIDLKNETGIRFEKIDLEFKGHTNFVTAIAITSDGRLGITGSYDNSIRLWDMKTGRQIGEPLTGHESWVASVAISPDDKFILSGSADKTIRLWNISSHNAIRTFAGHEHIVTSVAFSKDGRFVLSGSGDRTVRLWDVNNGTIVWQSDAHMDVVTSVGFIPDKRQLAYSASRDGTVRIWNWEKGSEQVRLIGFVDEEWIVITPEGFYTASQGGEKYLNVRIGNRVYGIENYRQAYFRPGIVENLALKGRPSGPRPVGLPPDVELLNMQEDVKGGKVSFSARIRDNGSGIGDVRVYLNDVAVRVDEVNSRGETVRDYSIKTLPGENRINVLAFNSSNTVRSNNCEKGFVTTPAVSVKPSFNALIAGVGKTKVPGYDRKDDELKGDPLNVVTTGLKEALEESASGAFEPVSIKLLKRTVDTDSGTIEKELSGMNRLNPDDVFVFSITSHGEVDEDNYCLIASDKRISSRELQNLLINIPSTKKLVILNTCHSGAFIKSSDLLKNPEINPEDAKRIMGMETGFPIFTATESGTYATGDLFIKAIIESIRRQKGMDAITVGELEKSVKNCLPRIVSDYNTGLKANCKRKKEKDCYKKSEAKMSPVIITGPHNFEITRKKDRLKTDKQGGK